MYQILLHLGAKPHHQQPGAAHVACRTQRWNLITHIYVDTDSRCTPCMHSFELGIMDGRMHLENIHDLTSLLLVAIEYGTR